MPGSACVRLGRTQPSTTMELENRGVLCELCGPLSFALKEAALLGAEKKYRKNRPRTPSSQSQNTPLFPETYRRLSPPTQNIGVSFRRRTKDDTHSRPALRRSIAD